MKLKRIRFRRPKITRKKAFVIVGAVAVLAAFTVIAVTTFTRSGVGLYQLALNNLAEARFYMKHAQSTELNVQFFSGMREDPYQVDGRASGTVPFALLNVEPRGANHLQDTELNGLLRIGSEEIEVELERNQFGRNFATDLRRLVEHGQTIEFILILENDYRVTFNLDTSMPEDSINWEEALRIAVGQMEGVIRAANSFEVYVKIITDQANLGSAFWYIQIVTDANEMHFVVIAPNGNVIGT